MKQIKIEKPVDDRKGWLGGSSWGAILGLSTYSTPLEIAKEYLGTEKREFTEEQQARLDMGHELEEFIARQATRLYGIKLQKTKWLYLSPSDKRLGCHPDRLCKEKIDGRHIAVEIKSSSAFDSGRWGDADTDQIPYDYLVQCYSYFECLGVDDVWLFRFANNSITRYIIHRPTDEDLSSIVKKISHLLDLIDGGWLPPASSYSEQTMEYSEPREGDIEATSEISELIGRWVEIKKEKKELEAKEDDVKKNLVKFLEDNQKNRIVDDKGKKLASYIKTETTRFDSKKFRESYPDLFEEFSYKTASTSLR